jgi:hypothetical protein
MERRDVALDKAAAQEILSLADSVTDELLRSVQEVSKGAPEHAALKHRRLLLEVLDPLSEIVFSLWRQYPELEPPREPGVTYYDPKKWLMSKRLVRQAARTLAEAERPVVRVRAIAEYFNDTGLATHAARALDLLSKAAFGIRQQHPAFRGARAAEDPLARPMRKAPKATHKARRRTKR